MLHNLEAEMARRNIKKKEIAEALGISERTLRNKLSGISDFTLPEATKIKDKFFPSLDLQYLFAKDEETI